mmetsp:Transcript_71917/g.208307  ORF Transcript_71917/g.208307 Transcript_71917/m.208307 type:complete len:201 (+) Transcript_71917:125-727(+)
MRPSTSVTKNAQSSAPQMRTPYVCCFLEDLQKPRCGVFRTAAVRRSKRPLAHSKNSPSAITVTKSGIQATCASAVRAHASHGVRDHTVSRNIKSCGKRRWWSLTVCRACSVACRARSGANRANSMASGALGNGLCSCCERLRSRRWPHCRAWSGGRLGKTAQIGHRTMMKTSNHRRTTCGSCGRNAADARTARSRWRPSR